MGNLSSGLEDFFIERTSLTPLIRFKEGRLDIEGLSMPKSSIEFYKPLLDYLEKYSKNPLESTKVNIKLDCFSATSSKSLLDVFRKFEEIHKTKRDVVINWYYKENDENILAAGEDYQSIIRLPFKMIIIGD